MPTHPTTPDGRYFVVRGRLWRCSDPFLPEERRQALVHDLMDARRDVGAALRADDPATLADARARVEVAKVALGGAGAGVVGRRRARPEPAHGAQHGLCRVVRRT